MEIWTRVDKDTEGSASGVPKDTMPVSRAECQNIFAEIHTKYFLNAKLERCDRYTKIKFYTDHKTVSARR
jgi:hypothetical protein